MPVSAPRPILVTPFDGLCVTFCKTLKRPIAFLGQKAGLGITGYFFQVRPFRRFWLKNREKVFFCALWSKRCDGVTWS